MHKLAFMMLLTAPFVVSAQEQTDSIKTIPATKLEAFSARTGIVLIKGFTTVGFVNGMGRVGIDAREFRDASNPKSAQFGVAFAVKESGRLERENTSFIDEDEIDSLLRGLDYISKIQKTVTALANFEAQYRTKGDLSFTVFSDSDGATSLAVSSGRIGKTTAFLKLSSVEQIRSLLTEAKQNIATAKGSAKS